MKKRERAAAAAMAAVAAAGMVTGAVVDSPAELLEDTDAVTETARQTDAHILPDDYATEQINRVLLFLLAHPEEGETASVTYFVPDDKKEGGKHESLCGIKKIAPEEHIVRMLDGTILPMDAITSITGVCIE